MSEGEEHEANSLNGNKLADLGEETTRRVQKLSKMLEVESVNTSKLDEVNECVDNLEREVSFIMNACQYCA